MMLKTQVIQSHRQPLPASWYQPCLASVQDWAALNNFDYVFVGDALLDALPVQVRAKTRSQPVIAADLGRLLMMQQALQQGWDRVVWFDADTLVVTPEALHLPAADHAFGREVWIQHAAGTAASAADDASKPRRLRVFRKIHNAFMCFSRGNPVLDFYLHAATRLVLLHDGPMAPQFIGPKFLATLHNLLQFPVLESAGVLCPLVITDLLAVGSAAAGERVATDALAMFAQCSEVVPAALNLCGSLVSSGELSNRQMSALIQRLLADPQLLAGPAGQGCGG